MNSLFALSLFPYLLFLFFLSRLRRIPRLALAGFWLLLLFVAFSIPAGLYAQKHYGTSLANVDPLHGGAEAFLTLSNILVALGFKQALDQKAQGSPNSPEQS